MRHIKPLSLQLLTTLWLLFAVTCTASWLDTVSTVEVNSYDIKMNSSAHYKSKIVTLLASKSLKFSSEGGQNWENIDLEKIVASYNKKHGAHVPEFELLKMVQDEENHQCIVLVTDVNVVFVTRDGGSSWFLKELPVPLDHEVPVEFFHGSALLRSGCSDLESTSISSITTSGGKATCLRQYFYTNDKLKTVSPLISAVKCAVHETKTAVCLTDSGAIITSSSWFSNGDYHIAVHAAELTQLYYDGLFIAASSSSIYASSNGSLWASAAFSRKISSIEPSGYPNTVFFRSETLLYKARYNSIRNELTVKESLADAGEITAGLQPGFVFNQGTKSSVSFDNGAEWEDSLVVSIVHKSAPLLLVGETKEHNMMVSTNGGHHWKKLVEGSHFVATALQGRLVLAVSKSLSRPVFSLDFGENWKQIDFQAKAKILSVEILDGTTFLAIYDSSIATFDFSKVVKSLSNCGKNEVVSNYVNESCFNGFRQKSVFYKDNTLCVMTQDSLLVTESCECSQQDYECAPLFYLNSESGHCMTNQSDLQPSKLASKYCTKETGFYYSPSGYMIKDGNKCFSDKHTGIKLDQDVQIPCPDQDDEETKLKDKNPKEKVGKVLNGVKVYDNSQVSVSYLSAIPGRILKISFLLKAANPYGYEDDEIVLVLTSLKKVLISYNHGQKWQQVAESHQFIDFEVDLVSGKVSLFAEKNKVVYSFDNGISWRRFQVPVGETYRKLRYHRDRPSWVIHTGEVDGKTVSYISTDLGASWSVLHENSIGGCIFVKNQLPETKNASFILCANHEGIKGSNDFFTTDFKVLDQHLVGFWSDHRKMLMAIVEHQDKLFLKSSWDGLNWNNLSVPKRMEFKKEQQFVFDMSKFEYAQHTNDSDIQFFVSSEAGPFGDVYKSNKDGDRFTLMASDVDLNDDQAEYQTLYDLPGIVLVNIVVNAATYRYGDSHNRHGSPEITKIIQTKISFDHGVSWDYLRPPSKDSSGNSYKCQGKSAKECSLHLYGKNQGNFASSQSAVGVLVAVGRVGDGLVNYGSCSTFISTDAGVSWTEVVSKPMHFEVGDRGGLIVLVDEIEPTYSVMYSTDLGISWKQANFSVTPVKIDSLLTVHSDSSRKFLLTSYNDTDPTVTNVYTLDFSLLLSKSCTFDPFIGSSDFESWSPAHPANTEERPCLFGKETRYYRKKPDSVCFIGDSIPSEGGELLGTCGCQTYDFECDMNYNKDQSGDCVIIPELDKSNKEIHSKFCKEMSSIVEYKLPSGYRKTSVTQCDSKVGLQLDSPSLRACPGKETQFDDIHIGLRGTRFFFMFIIIACGASVVGYFAYKHVFVKLNGRIRLSGDISDYDGAVMYLQPNRSFFYVMKHDLFAMGRKLGRSAKTMVSMVKELVEESNDRMREHNRRRLRVDSEAETFVVDDDDDDDGDDYYD